MTIRTFKEAANSYVEDGGSTRYLSRVMQWFGDKPVSEIVPYDVKQMALELYPDHLNSTRNRHAVTPAKAVLMHAYERGWVPLMRIRRFKQERPKRKSPASPLWLGLFLRQCDDDNLPHLAAIVLFMFTTGARVSEAIRVEWPDVNIVDRKILLKRTKTDVNSIRHVTDDLARRIGILERTTTSKRVFNYTSRYSVAERIKAVCKRAEIPYKSPHVCGRHSFATNAIALGSDIREAMEAGGWKSSSVFLDTYVHAKGAGRAVADRFNTISLRNDLD